MLCISLRVAIAPPLTDSQKAILEKVWPGRNYYSYSMECFSLTDPDKQFMEVNDTRVGKEEFERSRAILDDIVENP